MKKLNKANHSYFDSIDTERKAYFLGLLFADGTINGNPSGDGKIRQKQVCLALQDGDRNVVEELCKDLTPHRQITIHHPPGIASRGWSPRATFKVSSNQICDRLISLGCYPNKTHVGCNFPDLDPGLVHHFIRGFFDGDGCIYVREVKNRYVRKTVNVITNPFQPKLQKRVIITCTSKPFLEKLLSCIPITGKVQWRSKDRGTIAYDLNIETIADVQLFRDTIYKDATIYLDRKFQKFNMTISSQAEDTFSEGSETT